MEKFDANRKGEELDTYYNSNEDAFGILEEIPQITPYPAIPKEDLMELPIVEIDGEAYLEGMTGVHNSIIVNNIEEPNYDLIKGYEDRSITTYDSELDNPIVFEGRYIEFTIANQNTDRTAKDAVIMVDGVFQLSDNLSEKKSSNHQLKELVDTVLDTKHNTNDEDIWPDIFEDTENIEDLLNNYWNDHFFDVDTYMQQDPKVNNLKQGMVQLSKYFRGFCGGILEFNKELTCVASLGLSQTTVERLHENSKSDMYQYLFNLKNSLLLPDIEEFPNIQNSYFDKNDIHYMNSLLVMPIRVNQNKGIFILFYKTTVDSPSQIATNAVNIESLTFSY